MRIAQGRARWLWGALLLAVALTAGATATGAAGAKKTAAGTCIKGSGKTITIGASLSLSGDFSADGQAFKRGYQLWANHVNATGGLLGCQVKLDIVSDASSPAQVATNYEKLISSDHADLVFGPFSTLLTVPSAKIANRFGYAMIEGAGGAPAVFATGLHNVFDVSLVIKDQLVTSAKYFASLPKSRRPKTAAYPTSNDPFTEPQLPVARAIMEKAGIKTVYTKVFPAEVTDYTPIATAVAATKAQVVMLGSVDVPTVSAFIQAFAQQHYNPLALVATAGPDQGADFLKAVGGNAEGVMVPNGWYYGYANAQSHAMVKRLREGLRRQGGRHQRRRRRGLRGRPDRPGRSDGDAQPRPEEDHRLPAQRRHDAVGAGCGEVRLARRERGGESVHVPVAERQARAGPAGERSRTR